MRRDRSTCLRGAIPGVALGSVLFLGGCGGTSSEGNTAASTPEGKRFESLQQKGYAQSKADIAAKKKEAMAEIARKKAEGASP